MLLRRFPRCRIFCRAFSTETDGKGSVDEMPKKRPAFFVVTRGYKPGIYRDYSQVVEQISGYQYGRYKKFLNYDDAYFYYFHVRHTEVAEHAEKTELFEKVLKRAVAEEKKVKGISVSCEAKDASGVVDVHQLESGQDIVQTFCNTIQNSANNSNLYQIPSTTKAAPLREDDPVPRKSARLQTHSPVQYSDGSELEEDDFCLEQFELDIIKSIELESKKLSKRKRKTAPARNPPGRPRKDMVDTETGAALTYTGIPIVYTDGCCLNQKLPESERKAGCGVFWGKDDPRNLIERLWGPQTNQRAELWAAIRGVQCALQSDYEVVEVRTDSQYVIKGMTEWIHNWRKNNWVTRGNHPVKNRDMFVLLDGLCCYIDVRWVKVKGHSSIGGNDMADALARCGAQLLERKVPVLNPVPDQSDRITESDQGESETRINKN